MSACLDQNRDTLLTVVIGSLGNNEAYEIYLPLGIAIVVSFSCIFPNILLNLESQFFIFLDQLHDSQIFGGTWYLSPFFSMRKSPKLRLIVPLLRYAH
jgi:hypothetical protein